MHTHIHTDSMGIKLMIFGITITKYQTFSKNSYLVKVNLIRFTQVTVLSELNITYSSKMLNAYNSLCISKVCLSLILSLDSKA